MSNITDRELLTFCDLMNLPVEFSDVIESVQVVNNEKIEKHHTVASLIENDIKELKRRGEVLKKTIQPAYDRRKQDYYNNANNPSEEEWNHTMSSLFFGDIIEGVFYEFYILEKKGNEEKNDQDYYFEKLVKNNFIEKNINFRNSGMQAYEWWIEQWSKLCDYFVKREEEQMKLDAPMTMEMYVRMKDMGSDPKSDPNYYAVECLDEWIVEEAHDTYSYCKKEYMSSLKNMKELYIALLSVVENNQKKNLNSLIADIEKDMEDFPSREIIDAAIREFKNRATATDGLIQTLTFNGVVSVFSPLISRGLIAVSEETAKKLAELKKSEELIKVVKVNADKLAQALKKVNTNIIDTNLDKGVKNAKKIKLLRKLIAKKSVINSIKLSKINSKHTLETKTLTILKDEIGSKPIIGKKITEFIVEDKDLLSGLKKAYGAVNESIASNSVMMLDKGYVKYQDFVLDSLIYIDGKTSKLHIVIHETAESLSQKIDKVSEGYNDLVNTIFTDDLKVYLGKTAKKLSSEDHITSDIILGKAGLDYVIGQDTEDSNSKKYSIETNPFINLYNKEEDKGIRFSILRKNKDRIFVIGNTNETKDIKQTTNGEKGTLPKEGLVLYGVLIQQLKEKGGSFTCVGVGGGGIVSYMLSKFSEDSRGRGYFFNKPESLGLVHYTYHDGDYISEALAYNFLFSKSNTIEGGLQVIQFGGVLALYGVGIKATSLLGKSVLALLGMGVGSGNAPLLAGIIAIISIPSLLSYIGKLRKEWGQKNQAKNLFQQMEELKLLKDENEINGLVVPSDVETYLNQKKGYQSSGNFSSEKISITIFRALFFAVLIEVQGYKKVDILFDRTVRKEREGNPPTRVEAVKEELGIGVSDNFMVLKKGLTGNDLETYILIDDYSKELEEAGGIKYEEMIIISYIRLDTNSGQFFELYNESSTLEDINSSHGVLQNIVLQLHLVKKMQDDYLYYNEVQVSKPSDSSYKAFFFTDEEEEEYPLKLESIYDQKNAPSIDDKLDDDLIPFSYFPFLNKENGLVQRELTDEYLKTVLKSTYVDAMGDLYDDEENLYYNGGLSLDEENEGKSTEGQIKDVQKMKDVQKQKIKDIYGGIPISF